MRGDCLQQCQHGYHREGKTAAEIAARECMPVQEADNTWPGSVSTEAGESSHKVEGNITYDLQGLLKWE